MATGFTGHINRIVADGQVTADEFAELEQALFAGDGVVDPQEGENLAVLHDPVVYGERDLFVFDDPEDYLRVDLLVTQKIRTLDQYLEQLRTSAMTSRNAPEVLIKLAEAPRPKEPPVRVLSVGETEESFEVALTKGGETYWIDLPKGIRGETGTLIVTQKLQNTPCDAWEVMEALRKFATGRPAADEERRWAIDLAQVLHTAFRHQSATSHQSFKIFAQSMQDRDLSQVQSGGIEHLALSASDQPEIPVEDEGLFSSYRAESANPEIGKILSALRQVMPQKIVDWIRATHSSISFLPLSRHLRAFYNRHPEITEPILYDGFADVSATPPSLVLNSKEEMADLIYCIAHELGHLVRAIIRGETLTSRKTTGGTRESTSDSVLSAHWENWIRVKEGEGLLLSGSPTTYGGVSQEEWFADIFAIYFLGKASPFLEKTLAVSYEQIFEEFKQRDPVGYLLMVRLDQYLSGDNRYHPSVTFSWSGVNEAYQFLTDSQAKSVSGKPDPLDALLHTMSLENLNRLEQRWRNRPPSDLRAEREYARIVAMKTNSPDTYQAYMASLERLEHQAPFFYPARRDLWLEAVKLKMGEVIVFDPEAEILATPLSDEEIVTGIGGVMAAVPHDPFVVDELEDLMRSAYEDQNRHRLYEGETPLIGDRTVLARKFGPIVRKLAGEKEIAGLALLPYLLVLEGRHAEAARLLQDENSIVYANPKWARARLALSVFLPGTDAGKSADNLMQLGRHRRGFDEDFWPTMGFQGLVERLQKEQRYEPLLDLLSKIVEANPMLLIEVSRVLDRSVVEGHLKRSPKWEKIRRSFVEKFNSGFLLNPAVESPGFSKLYGIQWVEKDGLLHPQLIEATGP